MARAATSVPRATAASRTGGLASLGWIRAHLGRAAGEARAGARHGARALALRLFLGARRRLGRAGLLPGAEDLVLGLAREQLLELLGVDRLAHEQDLRYVIHRLAVVGEDVLRGLMRLLHDAADLVVDLARDLVRVVGLGGELTPQERHRAVMPEHPRAEPLRHPVAHHPLLGGLGDLLGSFEAPVVISPKIVSSAARPP